MQAKESSKIPVLRSVVREAVKASTTKSSNRVTSEGIFHLHPRKPLIAF